MPSIPISKIEKDFAEYREAIFKILNATDYFQLADIYVNNEVRADITDYYVLLRRFHDFVDDKLSEVKKVVTHMEETVLPELLQDTDEFGMPVGYRQEKSPRLEYTVYVGTENYVSLPDKPAAFQFLRDNDYGDAIEETVHHKRLPSIYREISEQGIAIPEGLFKVSTKHKARLRNN